MSLAAGRKRLFEAFETIGSRKSKSRTKNGPLTGLVISLSGLSSDKKAHFHSLVERLGGRYTRDLDLDRNTHLVAEKREGAKYDLAASDPSRIHMVSPSWLEACYQTGERAPEDSYPVDGLSNDTTTDSPIENIIDRVSKLLERSSYHQLWAHHQIFLLGFEDDWSLKREFGKLIRRGMGTIHWEMNDDVTIIIVHDHCPESLRKSTQTQCKNYPIVPPMVSPHWITECFDQQKLLQPSRFPPNKLKPPPPVKKASTSKSNNPLATKSMSGSLFRGSLFAFSRLAPSEGTVDFDSKELESAIRTSGGQMISLKLMDAMQADLKNGKKRRLCFVVCWGGPPRLELHPILSQLQRRNICTLQMVTPLWVKTCLTTEKRLPPEHLPLVFRPKSVFRSIKEKVRVSLTGFPPTEKAAMAHLLDACGMEHQAEMRKTCTHLVCKVGASGLKLEKAKEWGLHIVSVHWLLHIVEFGYSGRDDDKGGCEARFSVAANPLEGNPLG